MRVVLLSGGLRPVWSDAHAVTPPLRYVSSVNVYYRWFRKPPVSGTPAPVPRRKSVAQKSGAKTLAKTGVVRALGAQVRRLRLDRRLSQEKLAELSGINPKYLGRIELGKSDPGAYVLVRLAAAFRVPIGELFETVRSAGSAQSTTHRVSPADLGNLSDALGHLTSLVNRIHSRKPETLPARAPRRSRRRS